MANSKVKPAFNQQVVVLPIETIVPQKELSPDRPPGESWMPLWQINYERRGNKSANSPVLPPVLPHVDPCF